MAYNPFPPSALAGLIEIGDYAGAQKRLDEAAEILRHTNDASDWRNSYYRAKLALAMGKAEEAAPWVQRRVGFHLLQERACGD